MGILPYRETHAHDAARMGAARRPAPYPPDTAAAQAHRKENAPRPAGARRRARSALGLRMVRDARVRARFALVEIARAGPGAFVEPQAARARAVAGGWRAERRAAPMRAASCAVASRYGRIPTITT